MILIVLSGTHHSGNVCSMKGIGSPAYTMDFPEDQRKEYMEKGYRREVWYDYYLNLDSNVYNDIHLKRPYTAVTVIA